MCFDVAPKFDGELASVVYDAQYAAAFVYDASSEFDVQAHDESLFALARDSLVLDTDDAWRIDWDAGGLECFVFVVSAPVHVRMLHESVLQHYFAAENSVVQLVVRVLHAVVFVVTALHAVVFFRDPNHFFAEKLLQCRQQ